MLSLATWNDALLNVDNESMRKNAKLPKSLGKRVQKLRKKTAFTQEALAEKIGISRSYMGYIEQGRYAPSLEVLEKLARVLKVKMSDLF
jgi:DNA-binding XRE family transcriptional regulator